MLERRSNKIKTSQGHIIEEVKDSINLVFYEAAMRFDESRNMKFSTYLAQWCFWFFCKTKQKYEVKIRGSAEYADFVVQNSVNSQFSQSHKTEEELLRKVKKIIENTEDETVRKIFEMRYFSSSGKKLVTWKKISEKLNLTPQCCSYIHNKTIKQIKKKIKNEVNIQCSDK